MFVSYGDYSNLTAASFLSEKGKETPVFVRFSTVAGSRGSSDLARDVHGFATRFYTDEGNFGQSSGNLLETYTNASQTLWETTSLYSSFRMLSNSRISFMQSSLGVTMKSLRLPRHTTPPGISSASSPAHYIHFFGRCLATVFYDRSDSLMDSEFTPSAWLQTAVQLNW